MEGEMGGEVGNGEEDGALREEAYRALVEALAVWEESWSAGEQGAWMLGYEAGVQAERGRASEGEAVSEV